jgi:lipopolysaccharide cholinephosphotransferase
MNELQQKEFELLKEFHRICEELGLTYFLVCGSALGAVKYQGFIPWDDDVDVAMYREDYEIFIQKAPSMLAQGLFLQNHRTEPRFPQLYSKLRDSNTTYIEKTAAAIPMNHGIFIDIFPLDGYPKGKLAQSLLEFRKRLYQSMLLCAYDFPRGKVNRILCEIYRFLGLHRKSSKIAEKLNKCLSKYPVNDSKLVCNHGNWQGKLEYAPKWHYGKGVEANFQGLTSCVPERYDEYLRQKYGDWRADLHPEEQKGHHYHTVCDAHTPYTHYL